MSTASTMETRTSVKSGVGRLCFVGVGILLQVAWFAVQITLFSRYAPWITGVASLVAAVVVLGIYRQDKTSAMKTPWIILILTMPLLGISLYFFIGTAGSSRRMNRRIQQVDAHLRENAPSAAPALAQLREKDKSAANLARYVSTFGGSPLCENTGTAFYADPCAGLAAQKADLANAKHFIFMEYHAIEDAESFEGLRVILRQKAAEGVEVRLFYDDIGSIGFINTDFIQRMAADGIHCRVFNPMIPFVNAFLNNRDHRKITVIDGEIGYTGGYNLANEYFGLTHPYGEWKDSGVRVTGGAVRNLTGLFLELWNAMRGADEVDTADALQHYLAATPTLPAVGGYVQPYGDNPLDDERVGENVYLNLIDQAQDYVYFTTPYLIISDELDRALGLAAKRGVDVRIITPGIPDKKLIFKVTRSYYESLLKHGVRIFEYTPGFCHAKQAVVDGRIAACGTINLDYRSLYHHFENGCLLYDCDAVGEIKADFDTMFPRCTEVHAETRPHSALARLGECILRLFAPLL